MASILAGTLEKSQWVVKINELIDGNALHSASQTPISVFQLPDSVRDGHPEAYLPRRVAVGPYHHFLPELYKMDLFKLGKANSQKLGPQLHRLLDQIMPLELKIRASFDQSLEMDGETLSWVMLIDGLFLLELLQKRYNRNSLEFPLEIFYGKLPCEFEIVSDILKLENQIPLFVLKEICPKEPTNYLANVLYKISSSVSSLELPLFEPEMRFHEEICNMSHHLLHFLYLLVLLTPERIDDLYDPVEPMQYLYIRMVKARNVAPNESPYLKFRTSSGQFEKSKPAIHRPGERTDSPEWNQTFVLHHNRSDSANSTLEITVWDSPSEQFLGRVCFDLFDVPALEPPDSPLAPEWYRLEGGAAKISGYIQLSVWIQDQADDALPEACCSDEPHVAHAPGSPVSSHVDGNAPSYSNYYYYFPSSFPPDSFVSECFNILGSVINMAILQQLKETFSLILRLFALLTSITKPNLAEKKIPRIPCASELKTAGVRFKTTKNGILRSRFDRKTLTLALPCIHLDGFSQVLLRNLVAYEAMAELNPPCLGIYIAIMSGLLRNSKDLKILEKAEIVCSYLDSEKEAVEMFNGTENSSRSLKKEGVLKFHLGSLQNSEIISEFVREFEANYDEGLRDMVEEINDWYENCWRMKLKKFVSLVLLCCAILVVVFLIVVVIAQFICGFVSCPKGIFKTSIALHQTY